jgi:formylglycine-generating enzyme required for sulfatase activity
MSELAAPASVEESLPPCIIWEPDGKEMILIPACSFVMGRNQGRANERPEHTVAVNAIYVDRYPVTQAEYQRFVQETGHPVPCYKVEWADHEYNWDAETATPPADKVDHPVVMVSWEDATAYAVWSQKRLPTEAEWERVARGPDGYLWPWGDDFGQGRCNTKELNIGRTTSVYRFSPRGESPESVADLVGNVWEWTSSLYKPYPYDARDGRESPAAEGYRALRGGSWFNDMTIATSTARLDGDFLFFTNVGFRCVVSADRVTTVLQEQKD